MMEAAIRILINGAAGKMGKEASKAINQATDLQLVGQTGRQDDLRQAIIAAQANVVVDLTTAEFAFENGLKIIDAGVHLVMGTSGLSESQVEILRQKCDSAKLGAIIVPNFSLGALISAKCAQYCASYFGDVEIIEQHHPQKVDAPSSTAIYTAQKISSNLKEKSASSMASEKKLSSQAMQMAGARGATYLDIPIHSVRLPGVLAQQTILFGGLGETVAIQHNVLSRQAYMPGLCLACRKVLHLNSLVYGLEHLL